MEACGCKLAGSHGRGYCSDAHVAAAAQTGYPEIDRLRQ
jgi:hypothetical protein